MTTTLSPERQPRNTRMTRKEDKEAMGFVFVCLVYFVVHLSYSCDSCHSWS